jgi:hypothetical protein
MDLSGLIGPDSEFGRGSGSRAIKKARPGTKAGSRELTSWHGNPRAHADIASLSIRLMVSIFQ